MNNYKKFEIDFINAWNSHNIFELLKYYDDDMLYIHPGEEPKIIRKKGDFEVYLKKFFETFPDYTFTLINVAWNNNVGFGEWPGKATFNGLRYNLKISNKPFEIYGVDVLVLNKSHTCIKEEHVYFDVLSVLKAVGINIFKWKMNKKIVFTSLPGFTAALEATMILLAIPEISKEFSISYSESTLLIIIFVITETLLVIPFSLIADKKGIKKVMITGSFIMLIASILIFISNNFIVMLLLRAIQGIGGSMVILTSLSYASLISSDINRGKSIGLNHTIISLGYVIGLPLGGLMASINYKYLFLFTAFLSLLSIILIINIDEIKGKSEIGKSSFYITLLFSGLILSIYYIPFIIIAIIGLVLSFRIKLSKEFSLSSFSGFLHSITRNMLAAYFVFLLYSLKYSPLIVGLLVLIYPLFFTFTSFISGKLHDKYGLKIASLGFLSMSVFSLLLFFNFLFPEVFLGSSTGVATTSNTAYTMNSLNKNDRITGSGIRSLQGIVTNAIGLGIASKLLLNLNYVILIIIIFNLTALSITLILYKNKLKL